MRNIGSITLDTTPGITADAAMEVMGRYVGGLGAEDMVVNGGTLVVIPITPKGMDAETFTTAYGTMIDYVLAYRVAFRRPGQVGTWEAVVDAHTGEVLQFTDSNAYGHVQGGVYKTDKIPGYTETIMPFPYADYGSGTFCDIAGNYSGTTGTSTMNGRTGSSGNVGSVYISDSCGSISLVDTSGLINFSGSSGADCTTPGSGGSGNTHSSRTQYWNVSEIKIKAYSYLPGNAWLQGHLQDRVNLSGTCNAYWDGTKLNFFRTYSGSCGSTGELPGVSLHEWGHGMDYNDGSGSGNDNSPLETRADWTAHLQTHQSCLGMGILTTNCGGYGDACTSCTAFRDADYAKHTNPTPWTPQNKGLSDPGFNCSSGSYYGPCGWEDHCESGIATQALWDFVNRDLVASPTSMDIVSAWQLADRLFYSSMSTAKSMYTCTGSGTKTSNGCGTGSLYTTFRAIDDDGDGTANGTPHAAAIYAAMNRHGIACTTETNTNFTTCPTLVATTLGGTAGDSHNVLNWTSVANATRYFVFRNETDCTAGFTRIATVTAPAITTTDTLVYNGVTYNYRIEAATANDSCTSAMSACTTLTPTPCTVPGVPVITGVADVNTCTNSGITVAYTAGSPAGASYNLLKDAAVVVTGYTSGAVYVPGDASSHTYIVQAVSGTCTANSTGVAGTDANNGPAAPAGVAATTTRCTDVQVTCNTVTGATSYNVMRGTTCGTAVKTFTKVTSPYKDSTAVAGTTYQYWVVAVSACGKGGNSSCAAGIRLSAPAAPAGVAATTTRCTDVQVTWNASTGAASYNVLRGVTCGTVVNTFTNVTSPYTDTTAVAGTAYQYWVVAVNPCGNSAKSLCSSGKRLTSPAKPSGVVATKTRCTDVQVTWKTVVGATGYNVLRGTTCGTVVDTFLNATSPYLDTTAVVGTTYQYWVVAVNPCGNSANSSCSSGKRLTSPAAPTGVAATATRCTDVQVTWNTVTGATSYNVLRGVTCGTVLSTFTKVSSPYNDTTAVAGTTYQYWVVAVSGCTSADSACATGLRLGSPSAPAAPTFADIAGTTLTVNWADVSNEVGYQVQRCKGVSCTLFSNTGSQQPAGTTSYSDSGLTPSTAYRYRIVAKAAAGCTDKIGAAAGVTTSASLVVAQLTSGAGPNGGTAGEVLPVR